MTLTRSPRRSTSVRLAAATALVLGTGVVGLTSSATAAPVPAGLVLAPLLQAGTTTPICDVLDNSPDYNDVACNAAGVSSYFGRTDTVLAASIVLEADPRAGSNQAPFQSTTYVVQLGVNGVHAASFGINGKPTNDGDVLYAGCAGGAITYSVKASTALADSTITVVKDGAYWRLTFNVPLSSLSSCGITTTTPVAPFVGTSQAGPLENINKDFFYGNKVDFTVANTPPVADDEAVTVAKDSAATAVDVLTGDTDAENDPLTVTSVTAPSHGTTAFTSSGVTYQPAAGFVGTDTFDYVVSDGHGGTDTGTVTVTVQAVVVQGPPVADDESISVAQDSGASVVDVLTGDTDPQGDTLAVLSVTAPAHGVAVLSGGVVTYQPNAGYVGPDTFDYVVSDGHGGTDTGTVTVDVTKVVVNHPPVADDETTTVAQDSAATAVDVLTGDTDPDADVLTVDSVSGAAHGTVVLSPSGVVTYQPNAGYSGPDSFTYVVTDGALTDVGTVTVTVTPAPVVNRAPDAKDDAIGTAAGTSVVVPVLGNDTDPDGDALTVTGVGAAAKGTVTLVAGVVSYVPNAGTSGTDSFTYTISDGKGGTDTALVTVTVAAPVVSPTPSVSSSPSASPSASPSPSASASPTASASPSASPSVSPSVSPSAEASPISGVTDPDPETAPSEAAPSPLPSTGGGGTIDERPAALPFTGAPGEQLLALGAALSFGGLLLVLTGRRRRTA